MENEKMNDSSQLQPSPKGYPVDQKDMILALGAILCALFIMTKDRNANNTMNFQTE